MIGDQKQLGPVYKGMVDGPDSMFARLIEAGYPYLMLNEQYRMNSKILKMPNMLYYDGKIHNKYQQPSGLSKILKANPLLFINYDGEEVKQETSYANPDESIIV